MSLIEVPASWIHTNPIPFLFIITIIALILYSWDAKSRRRRHLPPGPRGLPLFGNLFQLSEDAWLPFTELRKQYGSLIYLNLAGKDVIVLGSNKVASDLLDKRASIYSDRPRFIVAGRMLTEGLFFTFAAYGDLWRRMRKAAHEGLHKGVVNRFHPIQEKESLVLLTDLQRDPNNWEHHLRRTVGSTVLTITYDTPTLKNASAEPLAGIFKFTKSIVRSAYVDGSMVEFFPWLQHVPSWMAGWKRDALRESIEYSEMFEDLYREMKRYVKDGEDRECFSTALVRKQKGYGLTDKEMAWLIATVAAGSETMAGVLSWFLLAMLQNPHIMHKAQAEIEEVVGRGRMPAFSDYDSLPYIRALVRESLRWHPVDPLGMQHASIEDDWYEGYFIPKGTICIANVWAMNRDTSIWGPNADQFIPERHLTPDGRLAAALPDTVGESHATFGFGRRICIGRHVANNSLFLNIASILWMFNIQPEKDKHGKDIIPNDDSLNQGLVVRPLPFNCLFVPRFPEAMDILSFAQENYGL